MKKYLYYFGLLLCVVGCGKDDAEALSQAEKIKQQLATQSWQLESATVNGIDKTTIYQGLSVTFAENTYTSIKGNEIWPASGTWAFATPEAKAILRDGSLQIDIISVSNTQLILSFQWNDTTFKEGRLASISGLHIFTFSR